MASPTFAHNKKVDKMLMVLLNEYNVDQLNSSID